MPGEQCIYVSAANSQVLDVKTQLISQSVGNISIEIYYIRFVFFSVFAAVKFFLAL